MMYLCAVIKIMQTLIIKTKQNSDQVTIPFVSVLNYIYVTFKLVMITFRILRF